MISEDGLQGFHGDQRRESLEIFNRNKNQSNWSYWT